MEKRTIIITVSIVILLFIILIASNPTITGLTVKILQAKPTGMNSINFQIIPGFSNLSIVVILAIFTLTFVFIRYKKKNFK